MIVLDTHVLIWWVADAARLSRRAKRHIDSELKNGPLIVSTISVLEIATAVRRGRLALRMRIEEWLADLRALPEIQFESVDATIAGRAGSYGESVPGDPADRIIVATASILGANLVTADERLRSTSIVSTIW